MRLAWINMNIEEQTCKSKGVHDYITTWVLWRDFLTDNVFFSVLSKAVHGSKFGSYPWFVNHHGVMRWYIHVGRKYSYQWSSASQASPLKKVDVSPDGSDGMVSSVLYLPLGPRGNPKRKLIEQDKLEWRNTNKFATSHTVERKEHLLPDMSDVLALMRGVEGRVGGVDSWRWMNMNSL